jgi:Ran GTPase-activating protein (RanGAP) involved in mRNA processing and transport
MSLNSEMTSKTIMVHYIRDNVEELNLTDKEIGDKGAKLLAEELTTNTSLKTLYLWNNEIGDDGAVTIAVALAMNKIHWKSYFWEITESSTTGPLHSRTLWSQTRH